MALNKKSCARVAAIINDEFPPKQAQDFLARITKAADTKSRSFRKTMKRIAKALKKGNKELKPMKKAA